MADIDGTGFGLVSSDSADGLTRAMILHPIACGIAFIAFLVSCGAGVFGSLLGAVIALIAWILTLVVMAIDFSLFGVSHLSPLITPCAHIAQDNQKPRQQGWFRLARLLLRRHVDLPGSHGLAVPGRIHCAIYML